MARSAFDSDPRDLLSAGHHPDQHRWAPWHVGPADQK